MNLTDCYRVLGLRDGASYEDIKASYRRLARRYHPDANPNSREAQEKFIHLAEAYKQLLDAVKPEGILETKNTSSPTTVSAPTSATTATTPRYKTTTFRTYSTSTETDQQLKEAVYRQLQRLLREQRFPRAITLVEGLAQRLPNDVEVRQWMAIAYQRWGRHLIDTHQPEKAKLYLNKALRTDPRNRELWYEVDRDMRRIDGIEVM
ncbi:DnaJ domain-containing protein [Leptolyngbya sp. AN02str]|uniref:J domain-containing protein n=1 Tax=Leptolyngbya sp. AN02str TaxID=3423363 RepID=UPI003D313EB5